MNINTIKTLLSITVIISICTVSSQAEKNNLDSKLLRSTVESLGKEKLPEKLPKAGPLVELFKPYSFTKGEFPRKALEGELKEQKAYVSERGIDVPVVLSNAYSKKSLSNSELVIAVRLGRFVKDQTEKSLKD